MTRFRRTAWLVVAVLGLTLAAWMPLSVARLASQSLDALPTLSAEPQDTNNGVRALTNEGFVLARRTYQGVDLEVVEAALFASGFETLYGPTPSQNGFALECCGEYDAIVVHLSAAEGDVVATTTAADTDVQAAGAVFITLGGVLAAFGFVMAIRRPRDAELAMPSAPASGRHQVTS